MAILSVIAENPLIRTNANFNLGIAEMSIIPEKTVVPKSSVLGGGFVIHVIKS